VLRECCGFWVTKKTGADCSLEASEVISKYRDVRKAIRTYKNSVIFCPETFWRRDVSRFLAVRATIFESLGLIVVGPTTSSGCALFGRRRQVGATQEEFEVGLLELLPGRSQMGCR